MKAFAKRISAHLDEALVIREGLWHEGPRAVSAAVDRAGSLRKAAMAVGLSPAYLCSVQHGRFIISPTAFCDLVRFAGGGK